jgi:hypothetical protein
VPTANGFAALGCSQASSFNFCFSVLNTDGEVVREVGDLPKISVPAQGYLVATAIAFYPPSDVIIVGHTTEAVGETPGGNGDGFIARYSTLTGSRVWIRQLGLDTSGKSSNQKEEFNDVAVGQSGEIYVVGRTRSNLGAANQGNYDALLAIFNSGGELRHLKQVGSSKDDDFYRVVSTAQGVVVGGHTCGALYEENAVDTSAGSYQAAQPCPSERSIDLVFASWSWNDATSVLTQNFALQLGKVTLSSGQGSGSDFVYGMAPSHAGEIYFTGGSTSALTNDLNGGQADLFVGKLGVAGNLEWIRSPGRSYSGSGKVDFGRSILVHEEGGEVNVLVCGETLGNLFEDQGGGATLPSISSNGKGDIVLLKMTGSGTLSESIQYGNATLGPSKVGAKEGCGRLHQQGSQIVLFGTSSGDLFTSGAGAAFFARDDFENFIQILKQ